jgi:hypothetical protein
MVPGRPRIDTNAIGQRGESIFYLKLSVLHGTRPLFRAAQLGEKWPVIDFAVELYRKPGQLFLVQVKATQMPINPVKGRLPIDVKPEHVKRLLSSPIPAYLVGVHEPSEEAFLIAPSAVRRIRDITTAFPLSDRKVRIELRQEVQRFWANMTSPFVSARSVFVD